MHKFVLSTDSTVDMLKSDIAKAGCYYIPLAYIDGDTAYYDNYDSAAEYDEFYKKISNGMMPTTTQLNPAELTDYFAALVAKENKEIVHLSLSSGLSNTFANAVNAAEAVTEQTGIKIYVVDTLSATIGIGSLFEYALSMRDAGRTALEVSDRLTSIRSNLLHTILVKDLFHLKRGGRISGAAAAVGTVLQLKPLLCFNDEGKLEVYDKKMGVRKAMASMLDYYEKHRDITNFKETVYMAHGADPEGVRELKEMMLERFPTADVRVTCFGPIIGAHVGPGTLAFAFFGDSRPKAKS